MTTKKASIYIVYIYKREAQKGVGLIKWDFDTWHNIVVHIVKAFLFGLNV